jgi:NIPSNAP
MQFQLRMYRVKPGLMDEWLEAFATGALPVRRSFGFSVLGPWIVREEDRFIWIVGHEDFATADKAYYDSPERAALDPPPTHYLDEIVTVMMEAPPASPTAAP